MVEVDANEIEFVKNFKLNGDWKKVGLSKAEVKDIQLQHIRDLLKLLINVAFEVNDSSIPEVKREKAVAMIFEAVASKNFTVIQSALDKKVLKAQGSEKK